MIDSGGDGPGIPTAFLQEILDNNKDIHEDARLSKKNRRNIALYLKAFRIDVGALDEKYGFGVDAVRAIQNSCTYQGFVCAVEGRQYRGNASVDIHSLDYKLGYDAGLKLKQRRA